MRAYLLILCLGAILVVPAPAQTGHGSVGLFADADQYDCDATLIEIMQYSWFAVRLAVISTDLASIGGYHLDLDDMPEVMAIDWPGGGVNAGDDLAHRVTYATPQPVADGVAVLASLWLRAVTRDDLFPDILPAGDVNPDHPTVVDAATGDPVAVDPFICWWTPGDFGVAYFVHSLPVEAHTLTTIKQLFH